MFSLSVVVTAAAGAAVDTDFTTAFGPRVVFNAKIAMLSNWRISNPIKYEFIDLSK